MNDAASQSSTSPAPSAPVAVPQPQSPISDSDDEDEIEQLQYKIVVLGDGAVGKKKYFFQFFISLNFLSHQFSSLFSSFLFFR